MGGRLLTFRVSVCMMVVASGAAWAVDGEVTVVVIFHPREERHAERQRGDTTLETGDLQVLKS